MTMTTTPFLSQKRRRACQRTPPHALLGKCEATTPKRRCMIMPILVDKAPSDARFVVGSLAVFVHLHEAGMGLLVDFRLIDPSLAILAIDRQALHFDEAAPNQFLAQQIQKPSLCGFRLRILNLLPLL